MEWRISATLPQLYRKDVCCLYTKPPTLKSVGIVKVRLSEKVVILERHAWN